MYTGIHPDTQTYAYDTHLLIHSLIKYLSYSNDWQAGTIAYIIHFNRYKISKWYNIDRKRDLKKEAFVCF